MSPLDRYGQFTVGEIAEIDCMKVLHSIDSCKEIYYRVSRAIRSEADEIFDEKVRVAPEEALEINATLKYGDKVKEIAIREPGETCGYDEIVWSLLLKSLKDNLDRRTKTLDNDAELALFGESVRFHYKSAMDFDMLGVAIPIKNEWEEANDTRAAVLIKCGLVTREEGQTLADYRPKIVGEGRKAVVEPIPMLSEGSKKLLTSLVATGRAITDLTPDEAKMLSRDFKEAARTIETEKAKKREAERGKAQDSRSRALDNQQGKGNRGGNGFEM